MRTLLRYLFVRAVTCAAPAVSHTAVSQDEGPVTKPRRGVSAGGAAVRDSARPDRRDR